jgi:hypothetical protein
MAGPITHIAMADKVYDSLFKHLDKKDFFIGNTFPDIRYLQVIDRDKTHFQVTLPDILKETDSFIAGVKFHSLVDLVLHKFMTENKGYELCPPSQWVTQTFKIFQDLKYYHHVTDWREIADFMDSVKQSQFEVDLDKQEQWYKFHQVYFKTLPTDAIRAKFLRGIGFNEAGIDKVNADLKLLENNSKVNDLIEQFYKSFEELIQDGQ